MATRKKILAADIRTTLSDLVVLLLFFFLFTNLCDVSHRDITDIVSIWR